MERLLRVCCKTPRTTRRRGQVRVNSEARLCRKLLFLSFSIAYNITQQHISQDSFDRTSLIGLKALY